MNLAPGLINTAVHDAQAMRSAGPDLLGLALMDARNRTLGWLAAFDGLPSAGVLPGFDPPWWLAGQAAWFQEYWIARHVQRGRGEAADATGLRLASIEPGADAWFSPFTSTRAQRWQAAAPAQSALQGYLAATLDTTLELLDKAVVGDAGLYFFRLALLHEDRIGEALAVLAQALDLAPERFKPLTERGLWPDLPSRNRRDAIGLPGQEVVLGSAPGGFVPDAEKWAHAVTVQDFETDAQLVSWAEFAEFVADGGYDERGWWTETGWALVEATSRRTPRYVEQMRGGVLARRAGLLQRLPLAQAALHVNAHEAAAWCQWAGRRLPTEAEWLLAAGSACSGRSARGFAWGDGLEWVAARARPFPDGVDGPAALDARPADGAHGWRVLRGASAWGSARLQHPQARRYAAPDRDDLFVGFRSCAL